MKILLLGLQFTVFLLMPVVGMGNDATSFNPVPIAVEAQAIGGVPVGTVIAWPVSSAPSDAEKWLECDGSPIPTIGGGVDYSQLRALVGSYVPNYQGMFLRGVGGNSDRLGSVQGDAIRNIHVLLGGLMVQKE